VTFSTSPMAVQNLATLTFEARWGRSRGSMRTANLDAMSLTSSGGIVKATQRVCATLGAVVWETDAV
jgi:hypothetical protein